MRNTHAVLTLVSLLSVPVCFSESVDAQAGRGGTPQEQLNRSADAVLALKSAKFTLTREGAPAVLDEANGITFTTAECSYAAPDRVSCNVKVTMRAGMVLQLTNVWVPEGAFRSNPLTRQFGKAPADSTFNGVVLFAKTGIPEILRTSVTGLQRVGNETIRSKPTVHFKGEVRGDKLNPLMGGTLKPELPYPVDLWMEEASSTPARIHVTEPAGNGWLIDLFAANEPVTIPTPQVPPAPARP